MSYQIRRDENTGLWVILFEGINLRSLPGGNRLSRAAEPQVAINLARSKAEEINDPITGVGPGTIPPLTADIAQQLLTQAADIEKEEQRQLEVSREVQGSGAQSAGAETLEAQDANAEASNTQRPGTGLEQQSDTGEISAAPATAVPSNAVSSQPAAVPEVPGAPSSMVPASPTAQNQLPGTPAQGQGTLQPPSVSDAQQFYIYKAIAVTSNFAGGKFTQDLEGVVLQIPIARATRQDGVLTPVVAAPAERSDTTPADARTGATPVPTVRPDDEPTAQAPSGDATVYGPGSTAPPDSDGQPVATAEPSGTSGEGSATTTVGGFTIKASSGTASNGVFVTVFVISRNGVQGFANDIDGIVAAAQSVQQRSFGGVVEDVAQWVAGGGAARLQQQAEAQAQTRPAAANSTVNLARET